METQELTRSSHRSIQLIVRDLEASRRFYKALFDAIGIPLARRGR